MKGKILVGKLCKILVNVNGKQLGYTATITSISESHIGFIDKFGDTYFYNLRNIEEIKTG